MDAIKGRSHGKKTRSRYPSKTPFFGWRVRLLFPKRLIPDVAASGTGSEAPCQVQVSQTVHSVSDRVGYLPFSRIAHDQQLT